MYDQLIYLPLVYHYDGMLPYSLQQPQTQTPTQPQNDTEFNLFDFRSQPEFVQQTQTLISDSEPEFVRETQPTQAPNIRKEKAAAKG